MPPRLSDLIHHQHDDDEDRVDGRELPPPREPGSDLLLILGLVFALARRLLHQDAPPAP